MELVGSLSILFIWFISLYFLKDTPFYRTYIRILSYTFLVYVSFNILLEEILARFINRTVLLIINIFVLTFILEGVSIATGIPFNRLNYLMILPVVLSAYFLGLAAGILFSIMSIAIFALSHIYILHLSHAMQDIAFYSSIYFFTDLMLISIAVYMRENIQSTRAKLRKAEISKERILESIPSGVLVLDENNTPIYTNPHASKIMTQEELNAFVEKLSPQETETRKEIQLGNKIIGYSVRTLPDNEKIIIFQDVTSIKKLEKERELNKKLIALGEMSAQLAHELRNPLTSIITATELLKEEGTNKNMLMEKIIEGSERLNRLITEFLSFTKITGAKKDRVNLSKIVKETTDRFAWQYKDIHIIHNIQEDVYIPGDPGLLVSVIENLLQNAVEALYESEVKKIEVTLSIKGGKAVLTVKDSGEGIDKNTLEHIFDPFFTTKTYGTGLGLSLVRKILSYHNAEIKIKSEKQKGTEFEIIFPLKNRENEK